MKFLLFTFLILLTSLILPAQDTLYVKGENSPLLIKITTVYTDYLNYIDTNGALSTIEMKNVKEVRLQNFFSTISVEDENKESYALDTLYLREEQDPLLVNILIVKKKSLNYNKSKGGLIHTERMKNVEEIRYRTLVPEVYPEFDEFKSTIAINSRFLRRYYLGINYLGNIKRLQSRNKKANFFFNIGAGYYDRKTSYSFSDDELRGRAKGTYFEFGAQVELYNPRKPGSRFHVGLSANNRWVERTVIMFVSFVGNVTTISDVSEFALQIPIGYTYRSSKGFYLSTGLEFTTEVLYPVVQFGLGFAFGK